MAVILQDVISVLTDNGEVVELMSTREELIQTYSTLREGIPENWTLPFSADTISMWDVVQHTKAMHLYPHVSAVFEHLGVIQLSLSAQEHQVEWIQRMLDILDLYRILSDTTPLGGGKTYMHCLLAQLLNLPLLVICPANVANVWEVMRITVPNLTVLSYDKVRSSRKGEDGMRELKHGLLHRIDTTQRVVVKEEVIEVKHCEFAAINKLRDMCANGLYIVIDEVQAAKNRSDQQAACRALIKAARESKESCVSLLSGSPFDKEEHVTNLMLTMGFIRDNQLVRSNKYSTQYLGLAELIRECKTINERMTSATISLQQQARTRKEAEEIVWKLYMRVIKPNLSGGASRPVIPFTQRVSNTSFVFSDEDAIGYAAALSDLRMALNVHPDTGRVLSVEFTTLASALTRMEARACASVAIDAIARLRRNPLSQVIIFCTYLDTYDILQEKFEEAGYTVGILNGTVSMRARPVIIDGFQRGEIRVLLAGVKVGGIGLSLHDRLGGRVRYSYTLPNWEALPMYQTTGRTYRPGTLSDVWCEFVYCEQHRAIKIIDAIHKKSEVIRESLANSDKYRIILPGEFPHITRRPGVD